MVGGADEQVAVAQPIFDALAPEGGFVHTGAAGTGHFTKMVHNGIEYGLMQAYAEGYELLARSGLDIDAKGALSAWRQGSVVRSWLLDLLVRALDQRPGLEGLAPVAQDSGEGRWTVAGGRRARRCGARHQRRAVRPLRQPGRRQRRDEGHRRAARAVRRPRRAPRGRAWGRRAGGPAGRSGGDVSDAPAPSDALVLFGATGDLARKKIFPAVYEMALAGENRVPVVGLRVLGVGRRPAAHRTPGRPSRRTTRSTTAAWEDLAGRTQLRAGRLPRPRVVRRRSPPSCEASASSGRSSTWPSPRSSSTT